MPNLLFDDEMSGHDSQVETIATDPVAKTVTVSLLSYPSKVSRHRIPIKIVFSEVISISMIMNLDELSVHRVAGNVAQWQIAKKAGTSFVSLAGGYLVIEAKDVPALIEGPE